VTCDGVVLLRCPCPDASSAARIADAALEAGLAAAATTTEGFSRYSWQGTRHAQPETVLTLTTVNRCAAALAALVARLHPYDLPAITWTACHATDTTAAWARDACAGSRDPV
jgi:periplasmic divalent cation tolerance protein